MIYHCICLATW